MRTISGVLITAMTFAGMWGVSFSEPSILQTAAATMAASWNLYWSFRLISGRV